MSYTATGNPTHSPSEEPLYNIGVVARMTGIPVATLRVWERRYDFPESARTAGGHRLYSEKEILRLRWVKARIDEGMQTGRAIRALEHLEQDDRLPDAPLGGAPYSAPVATHRKRTPSPGLVDSSLDAFHNRLVDTLLNHDLEEASQLLGDTMALYPLEKLLESVVQPALVDIGQAWHDGTIDVATEHLASNFLRNRLLSWMTSGPPAYDVPPIVLACAPDEWHEITLLIFGVLLRRRRWPVDYLGQSVPLSDLAVFVQDIRPDVVVLVAMTEDTGHKLAEWPRWLAEAHRTRHPVVCYAGGVFADPTWRERVPGMFLGATIQEGLETLESLLREIHPAAG